MDRRQWKLVYKHMRTKDKKELPWDLILNAISVLEIELDSLPWYEFKKRNRIKEIIKKFRKRESEMTLKLIETMEASLSSNQN